MIKESLNFLEDQNLRDLNPILVTDRLILKAPRMQISQSLAELANNTNVSKYLSTLPHPYSLSDAKFWIKRTVNEQEGLVFSIHFKKCDTLLGIININPNEEGVPVLGYWLGEAFWKEGYMTEAAQGLIDFVFSHKKVSVIEVSCMVRNEASRKVIEKCGFQYFKSGMVFSIYHKGHVPSDFYRLDYKLWQGLRNWTNSKVL